MDDASAEERAREYPTELVDYPEPAEGVQDADDGTPGERSPVSAAEALRRARAADNCDVGFCLRYVRTWWGVGPKFASAWKAWEGAGSHQHGGDRTPPKGAPVFYQGGSFGHIAVYAGDGRIVSTDCAGNGKVGTADLDWPLRRWGHRYVGWASRLNGEVLSLGDAAVGVAAASGTSGAIGDWSRGPVFVAKLRHGQRDSDSVRRLQFVLNDRGLATLPVTGNYLDKTRDAIVAWQMSIGESGAGADGNLGPRQAAKLFPDSRYDIR